MDVSMRDVLPEDLPVLYAQQLDASANRMAATTPRSETEFMTHWRGILADSSVVRRTVLLHEQIAGYVVSFERSERREVGYWIGRDYWGQGIASEALGRFLAIDERRPLFAFAAVHNKGSIRVLEKCGFVVTGKGEKPEGLRGPPVLELEFTLSRPPASG